VLSHRVSPRPGRLQLEPCQRLPLDWIKDNERVVLIWAAQTGKTIVLQCFLGWAIDQYPGPGMVVCPDGPFAKRRSTKHLRPFIEDSEVLSAHLPGDRHDRQIHEYTLDTMSVTIAWAGTSSTSTATRRTRRRTPSAWWDAGPPGVSAPGRPPRRPVRQPLPPEPERTGCRRRREALQSSRPWRVFLCFDYWCNQV